MAKQNRMIISVSPYLKNHLERLANSFGCSQAEVLRIGLVKLIKEEER